MYTVACHETRSVDSPGRLFLNLLDQASWCHVGMGRIFMAAQVWHGMSQALVAGHSSEQLVWQEQLEPVSSGFASVAGAADVGCMCGVGGVMQVVLLRSSVLSEPAVWQLCHSEQCQLL